MLHEETNKTPELNTELSVVGHQHELNQFDLAQWILHWMDTNWISHPEIKAWRIDKYVMGCGHPSATFKVIFDVDDRHIEEIKEVEKVINEEVSDYLDNSFGRYGLLEEVYSKAYGEHIVSDNLHHCPIVFLSLDEVQQGMNDVLRAVVDSGSVKDTELGDMVDRIVKQLPDDVNIQKPQGDSLSNFLGEEEDNG